jgi:hypothetical protein
MPIPSDPGYVGQTRISLFITLHKLSNADDDFRPDVSALDSNRLTWTTPRHGLQQPGATVSRPTNTPHL